MPVNVSVILCTWNNCSRLRTTMDFILRNAMQTGIDWELILVNNNCTDSTDEVANDFCGKLPVVYIYEPKQGLSRARNAGLNAATGDLVVFTDDDVMPCANWLRSYWNAYQEKPHGFYFGGPVESRFVGDKPDRQLLSLAPYSVKGMNWGVLPKVLDAGEQFIAANWACPIEPLRATGGFDTGFGLNPSCDEVRTGEENEIMLKLREQGLSPWYLPQAMIVHFVPPEKVTLEHIGLRARASAYYKTIKNPEKYKRGPFLLGVPFWLYKDVFTCLRRWASYKVKGGTGYQEYVKLNRLIGILRALRKRTEDEN